MVRTSLKCYIILLPLGKLNRRENVFSIWSEKYFKHFISVELNFIKVTPPATLKVVWGILGGENN